MATTIKIDNAMTEMAVAKGRISFPCIHKNAEYKGEERNYRQISLILDKDDAKHAEIITQLRADVKAYRAAAGKAIKNIPIKDGNKINDDIEEGGGEPREEYVNKVIITIQGKDGFSIFDGKRNAMQDLAAVEKLFYAGAYANAIISSTCYENDFGVTMNLQLNGIMFGGDGEPFGEATKVADKSAFDQFESDDGAGAGATGATNDTDTAGEEDDDF